MRISTLLILLVCLFSLNTLKAENQKPRDLVQSTKDKGTTFKQTGVFGLSEEKASIEANLGDAIQEYEILDINLAQLEALTKSAPGAMNFIIPSQTKNHLELELVQVNIFSDDFLVTRASDGMPVQVEHGIFYRGIIKGNPNSVAAISIFGDEVRGLISSDQGNYVLGKLTANNPKGEHILYNDHDVIAELGFDCSMPDDGKGYTADELTWNGEAKDVGDCIRIYCEVDFDIHNDKGGVTGATNYISGMMNEVITLYANENIASVVSQINVWDTTSPYSSTSSSGMLSDFQAQFNGFNGDLAQLYSYQASGGIAAGFAGICNSNPDNSMCFSSIQSSYSIVPTYSWTVMVSTHELGHLWGSRHTHACVWNGNNTAIDGCSGSTEGSCSLPGYPSQGGTIMSYCHLQSVGINFNEGFGPQPGNVIRNSVANASCTSPCGPPSCTDGIQNGNETGVDCGGPDCPACPTCNDGIQNGSETGVDCGGPDCAPCPCTGENVTLTLNLDNYPSETTWSITAGGTTYASGGPYSTAGSTEVVVTCLNDGCYDFNIFDSYGDGICCGYGNGSYTLEDESGNTLASGGAFGSSETTNFCVSSGGGGDTTPPTAPSGLDAYNPTLSTIDLTWGASSDNVGVDGYNVYMDGGLLGSVTGTSAQITGLAENTTYSFYVTAFDAAGNESSASNTDSETTLTSGGGGCTAGVIDSESFESGWGVWNDGGSDCARVNSSTRSWDGNYSIRIRDNSGTASSMTSDAFDLSEYSTVDIEFYFYPNSMENGEDFWVRVNNGSGWTTVASYAAGTSFNNNSFYTATVTVPASSLSASTQIRFQCDASGNADRIYIDAVTITGNCGALIESNEPIATIEEVKNPYGIDNGSGIQLTEDFVTMRLFPNPTKEMLNVAFNLEEAGETNLIVTDLNGRVIEMRQLNGDKGQQSAQIDVNQYASGIYIVHLITGTEKITQKFVVTK